MSGSLRTSVFCLVFLSIASFCLAGGSGSVAVIQASNGAACTAAPRSGPAPRTIGPGNWIYSIDVEAVTFDQRCHGVENVGGEWWVTGAADLQGAYLYRISANGTSLINLYHQWRSGWGWNDLAFDGTFLYASDSYAIEQIDPATGSVTGVTIASPVSPARALAYDPVTDSFWVSNYKSSIYNVRRDGSYTAFPNTSSLATYGMAMDDGLDTLWIWSQDGSGCLAASFDPRKGVFTGSFWDGNIGLGGKAGGACIFNHPVFGTVFAGMQQANPDTIAVYELGVGLFPQLDIKCNGRDRDVLVPDFVNAKVTVDIEARGGAGVNVDIWCILKRVGGGFYTFDGSWHAGLGFAAHTGPLFDISLTILDRTLPVGDYVAHLAIDTNANGVLDMGSLAAVDSVDFTVATGGEYRHDDGSTESSLGLIAGGDICWMHRFTTITGGTTIKDVRSAFGSVPYGGGPADGTPCTVYVWDDPTNDGDPSDCILLTSAAGQVAGTNTDLINVFPVTATAVTGDFYVGCVVTQTPGEFPAPMDENSPYTQGDAWLCYSLTPGGFDAANLTNNDYLGEMASSGYLAYWLLRAGF